MHIRFLYYFILLFVSVNSRLFGKILFGRYFSNFLNLKSNKNELFNNKKYNHLSVKTNKPIIEINLNNTDSIDIILENIDKEIYIILEQIFYNIL
jgi:hypothetical protein